MGILSSLVPFKDWIYIGIIVFGVTAGGIAWHEHNVHEQQLGAQRVEVAVKSATDKLTAQNQKDLKAQAEADASALKAVEDGYAKRLDDSNKLTSDLNRRLRILAAAGGRSEAPMSGQAPALGGSDGSPGIPASIELALEGVVTAAGHDADKVIALQDYINNVCTK